MKKFYNLEADCIHMHESPKDKQEGHDGLDL